MQKVVATVNLERIRKNALLFKEGANTKLCCVVKANAYGHGGEEVANALSGLADCFAVALVEEGLSLRQAVCGKDILVFTPPTSEEEGYELAVNGFLVTLPDLSTAKLLARVCEKFGLTARAHLKVNTGMNRYGMDEWELKRTCAYLRKRREIEVEGIYSHLYERKRETAEAQRARFLKMLAIARADFPQILAHLSATYGALLGKDFAFDMVRVGLGLYGYAPLPVEGLAPAMRVDTKVICSRKYAFGGLGYGDRRGEKGERLSVCRFGYADGVLRARENGVCDWQKNANALCMDACIRKGGEGRGALVPMMENAEETANATGTIPYEVLCAITRRAEFVYI